MYRIVLTSLVSFFVIIFIQAPSSEKAQRRHPRRPTSSALRHIFHFVSLSWIGMLLYLYVCRYLRNTQFPFSSGLLFGSGPPTPPPGEPWQVTFAKLTRSGRRASAIGEVEKERCSSFSASLYSMRYLNYHLIFI